MATDQPEFAVNMNPAPSVVGLGEILWDLLPSGRQLGGAPANFAYCSHLLGNRGIVASRIGSDDLGNEVRNRLLHAGVGDDLLQADPTHPTGTVNVELDSSGQPSYDITQDAAWDFMEWTDSWQALAQSADAVCFGSLAQRSPGSRATILRFLEETRHDAVRVFDVNLRQQFYSAEVIQSSLQRANVVKLNHDELLVLKSLIGLGAALGGGDADVFMCRELIKKFELRLACVTHGVSGSLICDRESLHRHPGFRVAVSDTVGAGDAFTAGLVHALLTGESLAKMNDLANRMGAWVASYPGAMPPLPEVGLERSLMRLG
jgi:fructokinase